jgi:predicted secreted protein with PEFG-CTERM motif
MAAGEYAIGADYMIEVSGLCCDIASVTVRSYDDDGWVLLTSQAEAAKDESRMEVGVASSVIGGASQIDFIIETTDWCGERDTAPNEEYDLVMRTWAVDSSGPTATATQSSNQRKVFQDGANFWSFYVDTSDTIYAYSSDGGLTWTKFTRAFTTTGITGVSVWYDPVDDTVYAIGDTNSNTNNVRVISGTVGPSSITWGTEYTVSVSSNGMSNKNTFICKDADGYLWIMATVKTGSGSTFDLAVYQSDDPDQIDAWTLSSLMLTTDSSTNTVKGSILPTGSDVWAVYNYDLKVAARKCTGGSWGSEESILAGSGTGLDYINTAPASAVIDEDGVVHVVYGDDTKNGVAKPSIKYRYRGASSWSSVATLDDTGGSAANKHPSISLDTASDAVYAVWVQDDTENLYCKKLPYGSSTWSSLTIGGQTSYEKNHLTSVYSVSGESNICWIWTQNKTGTIEVFFHKIPEFQEIALPVFTIMIMFIVLSGRKNARRKKDGATQQVSPIDETGF